MQMRCKERSGGMHIGKVLSEDKNEWEGSLGPRSRGVQTTCQNGSLSQSLEVSLFTQEQSSSLSVPRGSMGTKVKPSP